MEKPSGTCGNGGDKHSMWKPASHSSHISKVSSWSLKVHLNLKNMNKNKHQTQKTKNNQTNHIQMCSIEHNQIV